MILKALYDYYCRTAGTGDDAPPVFGYDYAKVSGAIQIDLEGNFLGIIDERQPQEKGKPRPRLRSVPQPPQRTVGVSAGFLCDASGYFLGYNETVKLGAPPIKPEKLDRILKCHAASAECHHALLDDIDHPVARAVLRFFDAWDAEAAPSLLTDYDDELAGWLVFLIRDKANGLSYAHEVPEIIQVWNDHIQSRSSDILGQCLVTGRENVPIARLHGAIKGVRDAQSSGASLVSFNFPAAISYDKTQSYNAPTSEVVAFGYVAALNSLLRPGNSHNCFFGDTAYLTWAERETPAENLFAAIMNPPQISANAASQDDEKLAKRVRDTLERLAHGKPPLDPDLLKDKDVRFYILGVAPNAARLSVRMWTVNTLGELMRCIGKHHEDLALVKDHPDRVSHFSLWALAQQLLPKDSEGKTRGKNAGEGTKKLCGDLFRAVVTGGAYPASLVPTLLGRFRNDRHITYPRVALLKAALTRHQRLIQPDSKEILMALDETRTDIGYRLGRLFSVLERLQEVALGKDVNATIRDKFVASASATPATAFPYLLRLSLNHMKKARRKSMGSAVFYDKLIGEISNDLVEYPLVLSPMDQGMFFLGYYQQRQDLFKKNTDVSAA